ncbi:unnamed protein product (macronuclear) [Paramecium tetraurelia]|uniref:Uncharacterized protein n=1 Tax=Paramecium tetraurelia TaxID=5888 RepID=A0E334_PARTE|nr:uncharacterized protein GSPATT00022874001 [Paramecium tetraurelia]CAK89701.1 unnamed protein product [Paramecium tetraurelia]|eukprot:XP_001457098.1 hypothetical protein (macronuclear) [Paramecium tetraurelia strain d4-2]
MKQDPNNLCVERQSKIQKKQAFQHQGVGIQNLQWGPLLLGLLKIQQQVHSSYNRFIIIDLMIKDDEVWINETYFNNIEMVLNCYRKLDTNSISWF